MREAACDAWVGSCDSSVVRIVVEIPHNSITMTLFTTHASVKKKIRNATNIHNIKPKPKTRVLIRETTSKKEKEAPTRLVKIEPELKTRHAKLVYKTDAPQRISQQVEIWLVGAYASHNNSSVIILRSCSCSPCTEIRKMTKIRQVKNMKKTNKLKYLKGDPPRHLNRPDGPNQVNRPFSELVSTLGFWQNTRFVLQLLH